MLCLKCRERYSIAGSIYCETCQEEIDAQQSDKPSRTIPKKPKQPPTNQNVIQTKKPVESSKPVHKHLDPQEIYKLREDGMNASRIAEKLGVSEPAIFYHLRKKYPQSEAKPAKKMGRPKKTLLTSPELADSIKVVKLSELGIRDGYAALAYNMLQRAKSLKEDEAAIRECQNENDANRLRSQLYKTLEQENADSDYKLVKQKLTIVLYRSIEH